MDGKRWKIFATLCVFAMLYQIYWTLRLKMRKQPPGPSRLLIYYYLIKTRLSRRGPIDEMEYARIFYEKYGKKTGMGSFSLLGIDLVNIYSSKLAKQILNHKNALARPIFHGPNDLNIESTSDGTNPFSNINGKEWERRRKLAQSIMFRMCTSKFVGKILDETMTNIIIPKLNEKSDNNELWYPLSLMKYCAFNTVFYANYGKHMPHTHPLYEPMIESISESFQLLKTGIILALTPKWALFFDKLLPNSSYYKIEKCIKKREKLFIKFKAYIDENKIKQKQNNENDEEAVYYIDYVQNELTESEATADTQALFGAGTDTTSSSLNFAIIFCAKYPKIQKKVRNELMKCYNKKKDLLNNEMNLNDGIKRFSINWLNELHIFRAFIYEIIRVSSVTKAGLPHYAIKDIYVDVDNKQYCIPKGTVIGYNIELMHKNTNENEYWIDSSNNMCLENWINKTTNKFEINPSFLSFGSGRRDCVGRNLALKEIYQIMAYLLLNYSFSFENDCDKEIKTVWNGVNVIDPPVGVVVKRLEI